MKKISILFLAPGPTYNADSPLFKAKYVALGFHLKSYFLTTSDKDECIEEDDLEYHSMQRSRWFTNLQFILFCLRKALIMRRHGGVDCIITYDPLKTGFIGVLLKKILGAQLIVEVNGVYTSSVVWEDDCDSITKKMKRWFVPKLMSFVFYFSDGIKTIFPSQIGQFDVITKKKFKAVFPNWVPVSNFSFIKEEKEILFVGFPFKIKGVDVLINAFKIVAPIFPDWRLKILGWYPDMSELSAAIGGHPQIYHHPPVSYSEMVRHIGKCGIFVLPSRTEAMGRVLLESAAAGKPRIGSRIDGIPTVIDDGEDGFLVEPENADELAEKMAMLMKDEQLRRTIGEAAANRARHEFSEQKYVQNFLNFVRQVLSS